MALPFSASLALGLQVNITESGFFFLNVGYPGGTQVPLPAQQILYGLGYLPALLHLKMKSIRMR